MLSKKVMLVRSIVDQCIEVAMDEVEEAEVIFKKGHLSPLKDAQPKTPLTIRTCASLCGGTDLCDVCNLPTAVENMNFPLCGMDINSSKTCKPCECCHRSCVFKQLLFNAIGEALLNKGDDIRQAARELLHLSGDLILALREVNSRLSHLVSE